MPEESVGQFTFCVVLQRVGFKMEEKPEFASCGSILIITVNSCYDSSSFGTRNKQITNAVGYLGHAPFHIFNSRYGGFWFL